jgi:hypothetical protein
VINLQWIVEVVLGLLVIGAVFGLLLFLVNYVARTFPGPTMDAAARIAKLLIVVLFVLVLIALLIGLVSGGGPVFRWGPNPVFR